MIGEVRKQSFNLTEDSLFRHCLVDGEILREILEELWQWSIEKLVEVHHDYNIEPSVDHRMITCDIYARDDRGDIYILEMQNQSKKNLRKRSKCYQSISMFDKCTIKEVKKEKRRYDSVVECSVVFLCCFDVSKVFERLRFPIVEEVPGVIYRGDSNMFVNIKNYRLLENDRLRELFRFMVDSSVESLIDWMPSNELRRKVADAEREESMDQTWSISEARLLDKYYDGRDDGYEEGVDLTNRAVIKRMADRGCSIEFIVDMVNVPVEQVKEVLLEGE